MIIPTKRHIKVYIKNLNIYLFNNSNNIPLRYRNSIILYQTVFVWVSRFIKTIRERDLLERTCLFVPQETGSVIPSSISARLALIWFLIIHSLSLRLTLHTFTFASKPNVFIIYLNWKPNIGDIKYNKENRIHVNCFNAFYFCKYYVKCLIFC